MNYTYTQQGRQRPIFFGQQAGCVAFAVTGEAREASVTVEVTYDPRGTQNKKWEVYEALGGVLEGPPTALRLHVLEVPQAPVCLWVKDGGDNG